MPKSSELIRIFVPLIREIFITHSFLLCSRVTMKKVIQRPQNLFCLGTCIIIFVAQCGWWYQMYV